MLSEKINKNLLDLDYHRNLQYFNACFILIFTYFSGLTIAILTSQIDLKDIIVILFTLIVSLIFTIIVVGFMLYFKENLDKITNKIKELKIQ